ncbi:MAG TPA: GNAT family protein [Pseudomonas sp.]|nr:GNAT family protein [Pseudomonas sp.]
MNTETLLDWKPAQPPAAQPLTGRLVRLEPLERGQHGADLWQALQGPESDPKLWDYLPYGPFGERGNFDAWLDGLATTPRFYAVIEQASGRALGLLSYLNIVPAHGSIEIGHICYGRAMQRTAGATEVIYLLARHAFELGYRRLEWKCNNLNARSKRAAERFGFCYEGLFRQHLVIKGRNRDTAWYALLDQEWPACREAFERWLAADNFDTQGRQKHSLAELREARA